MNKKLPDLASATETHAIARQNHRQHGLQQACGREDHHPCIHVHAHARIHVHVHIAVPAQIPAIGDMQHERADALVELDEARAGAGDRVGDGDVGWGFG